VKATRIALIAFIAAACSAAHAVTVQKWTGAPQDWTWGSGGRCRLQVTSITQSGTGQPIQVKVVNLSTVRVKYLFYVDTERWVGDQRSFNTFSFAIASAQPGATSVGSTLPWTGFSLTGAKVRLTMGYCDVVN
jgi:hypothetical protein